MTQLGELGVTEPGVPNLPNSYLHRLRSNRGDRRRAADAKHLRASILAHPPHPWIQSEERGSGSRSRWWERGVGQGPAAVEGSRPVPCVTVTSRAAFGERRPASLYCRYGPAFLERRQFRLVTQAACLTTLALTTHVLHSGGGGRRRYDAAHHEVAAAVGGGAPTRHLTKEVPAKYIS